MDPAPALHHPRLRLLLGALCALGLGALALGWQGGGAWAGLLARAGPTHIAVAVAFVLALGLMVAMARRLAERPVLGLLLGLGPLGVGALLAGLTASNVPGVEDLKGHCDLLLAMSFQTVLLWVAGLLGTGALWLGCLPALWPLLPAEPEGPLHGRAALVAALLLWVAALVVAFLDGLMPERGAVGGAAARGLWPLALALPALAGVAHALRRAGGPTRADAALATGWAAAGGLLGLALSGWLAARAWGLGVLAFELEGVGAAPVWDGDALEASLVAGIALRGFGPALALALAATALVGWLRGSPGGRRLAVGLCGGAAVAALLAWALLAEQAAGFEERCAGLQAPGLTLGLAGEATPWADEQGPVLWISPAALTFDDQPLDPTRPRLPAPPAPGARLLLAIDAGAKAGRLLDALEVAGLSGWVRFALLLRPPPPAAERCALERRTFGLCLSARVDGLRALEVGGPGAGPPAGQGRLVANLLVGAAEHELTFGGFGPGTSAAELTALDARAPRGGGDDGRGRLVAALARARAAFPESHAARVVVEDRQLPVAGLVLLLEAVRDAGFGALALGGSTR